MIRPCKDAWAVARTFRLILKSQQFFLLQAFSSVFSFTSALTSTFLTFVGFYFERGNLKAQEKAFTNLQYNKIMPLMYGKSCLSL